MAQRLANKINRTLLRPFGRPFSSKPEYAPSAASDAAQQKDASGGAQAQAQAQAQVQAKRYSISQPSVRVMNSEPQCETQATIAKKNVERQHLQPAMLPEYFKPPLDLSAGIYPGGNTTAEFKAQNKRFSESKTVLSINSPLKASKLANPFPEPVKVMPSHTVSDQEKADQMLADSRMVVPKASTMAPTCGQPSEGRLKLMPTAALAQTGRSFATKAGKGNKKKCKLGQNETKCPAYNLPGCEQAKSKKCGRLHPVVRSP